MQRARSVFERALDTDHRSITLWLQYAEMEMRQILNFSCSSSLTELVVRCLSHCSLYRGVSGLDLAFVRF